MKRLIKWLRRDKSQQSIAGKEDQVDVGIRVRPEQKKEDEYSDDSSFNWFETGQADSSIFDTGSLATEKSEDENAVPHKALELEGDSLCSGEEDNGVDPYNTGRFGTEK